MVQHIRQADRTLAFKHKVQNARVITKEHALIIPHPFVAEGADVEQLVPAQRAVKTACLEGFNQKVLGVAHAVGADGNLPPRDRAVVLINRVAGAGGNPHAGRLDGVVQPLIHIGLNQVV